MQTPYFTDADHQALNPASSAPHDTQSVYAKFFELHQSLYRRIRDRNWDLYPHWDKTRVISGVSAASRGEIAGLALTYLRSKEQAALVERLMGRDYAHAANQTDSTRHPSLELRLTPDGFTVELILNPAAWWDQRNLIGKLSLDRHRAGLRSLMQKMDSDFTFGFFEGCHLDNMHLTTRQMVRGKVLDEWMGTFADGQDWLRVGVWYTPEHEGLAQNRILSEVLGRMDSLYALYQYIVWTSNNNYQSFYPKSPRVSNNRDGGQYN